MGVGHEAGLFAPKLGLVVLHHKLECPVETNWITEFEVKVTVNIHNDSVCLSGYLLNLKIFCYQTWYGDAAS